MTCRSSNGHQHDAVMRVTGAGDPAGDGVYGKRWMRHMTPSARARCRPRDPSTAQRVQINLNATSTSTRRWHLHLRIYDSLACGGFDLSDPENRVVGMGAGYEAGGVPGGQRATGTHCGRRSFTSPNEDERRARVERGQRIVREKHSYAQRVQTVLSYLKAKL
jgi:hypothetical protein